MSFSKKSQQLLPLPEEEAPGQASSTTLEVGGAEEGQVRLHGMDRSVSRRSQTKVANSKARLAFTLGLHLVGFVANLAVLASFAVSGSMHFFPGLVVIWMLNAGVCTWVAARDPQITCLAGVGRARLPFLFVVYGVFQYVQVKHLIDVYRRRQDTTQRRSEFHAKTVDGISFGFPFAVACMWTYFLVDEDMRDCPWYMWSDRQDTTHGDQRNYLLLLYLAAAVTSTITLSMGIIEVDYRVSDAVRRAIDGSLAGTFLQFSYRVTEAGSRICGIVLLCVVFEPTAVNLARGTKIPSFFIMSLYPIVWFVVYYCILATSRAKGAKRDQFLAHFAMAIIMWVVNPFRFVDSPTFITAARHINVALWLARLLEFAVVILMLIISRNASFPAECKLPGEVPVLYHIVHDQHERLLPVFWAVTLVLHAVVCNIGRFRVWNLFRAEGVLTDDTVLDMIPAASDGENCECAVAVRPTVARGIASHVLRVGTGITSQIFAKEEQAFGDFVIDKVLGRGGYGVVVMVRMRNKRSDKGGVPQDVIYAMKMQNTEARRRTVDYLPSREATADREREIMRKLDHPFIIRLAYFFEVPDRELKDASSGETIRDVNNNSRFHKALVMEYCPGGDLDGFILKRAFPVGYKQPDKKADASAADWPQLARRLAAEMCVALAFLHEQAIVYRDLKPQNVLLKSGGDSEMHICFTDFGFSKDVESPAAGRLDSLAGSPLYAAPEVMAIATRQARAEYTPAVDLFSLGRTICVMLWRQRLADTDPPELKMPTLEECRRDPTRVHDTAWSLMSKLTSPSPGARGQAADLERHAFFREVTLLSGTGGRVLPPLIWADLERNASR